MLKSLVNVLTCDINILWESLILLGKMSGGGRLAFACVPSAAFALAISSEAAPFGSIQDSSEESGCSIFSLTVGSLIRAVFSGALPELLLGSFCVP